MDKVKYVHILRQNEIKFSVKLADIINNNPGVFKKEEHLLVTPHEKVYNCIKQYDNVVLDLSNSHLINKYADRCNYLFLHGRLDVIFGLKIKRRNLRKIIWRFWGGNLGYSYTKGETLKNAAKKILNFIYLKKISHLAAIGIANSVDEVAIRKVLKDIQLHPMTYGLGKREEILEMANIDLHKKDDVVNVVVGHSAWPYNNHIEVINKLLKYENRIRIYVPVSYGEENYKARLMSYIKELSRENIITVDEFMLYDDYVRFLNKMDIAIFDGTGSYALGNVSVLLLLRKKLFLNSEGVIKEAFDFSGMPCYTINAIDSMNFEEFVKKAEYPEKLYDGLIPYSKEKAISAWKTIQETFN